MIRAIRSYALLALLLAACQDPAAPGNELEVDLSPGQAVVLGEESGVTLQVEAETFAPGEPATLVLENGSDEVLGFNLCFHALERWEGDAWELQPDDRICTAHLELLDPEGSATYETTFNVAEPGQYRFRIALYRMDSDEVRDLVSEAFELGG